MDYREIENRLERNREMINERAYERKTKAILEANQPRRPSIWPRLGLWLSSLKWRKAAPQPCVPMNAHTPFDLR